MFTQLCNICSTTSSSFPPGSSSHQHHDGTFQEAENIVVREMNALSFHEQKRATEDIHCVPDEDEETPKLIEESLSQMEEEIQKKKTYVYEMAEGQCKEFVTDRDFRLMFLRADFFNVKAATKRFMKFLQQKLMYFGQEKLTKDIEWSDLNQDDVDVLESGFWHVQHQPDRSNRPIVVVLNHADQTHHSVESLNRASYFTFFILLRSVDTQKKGFVGLYYETSMNGHIFDTRDIDKYVKLWTFNNSVPIRHASIHVCLKRNYLPWFVKVMLKMQQSQSIVRTKFHSGSDIEMIYNLRSYGIEESSFPISSNGQVRQSILNNWLDEHKFQAENNNNNNNSSSSIPLHLIRSSSPSSTGSLSSNSLPPPPLPPPPPPPPPPLPEPEPIVASSSNVSAGTAVSSISPFLLQTLAGLGFNRTQVSAPTPTPPGPAPAALPLTTATTTTTTLGFTTTEPNPRDVLLGRGKRFQNHYGNKAFRKVCEIYKDEYDNAGKKRKREFARHLAEKLNASGARFLKLAPNSHTLWVESEIEEAETTVMQLFRSLRKSERSTFL